MKRLLSLLLAVIMAFSLSAPALADQGPAEGPASTATPTPTPTPTAVAVPTDEPAATEGPEPTATAEPVSSPEPTGRPVTSASPEPAATAEPTSSPEPTATAEPTASPEPTATAEPTASPEPTTTAEPTASPEPSPIVLDTPVLTGASCDGNGARIVWKPVAGAERYRVFYKTGSGSWIKAGDTDATSFVWTKAKNASRYAFTVRCLSADVDSYASSYDPNGLTLTYYAAPTVKISVNDAGGVKVTWDKIAGAARYAVYYKENGGAWKKIGTTAETSYTWTKAKAGNTYQLTVRTCRADKVTVLSGYKPSNTVQYTAAPKISAVTSEADGVKIAWGAVQGAAAYRVFYKGGGVKNWKKLGDAATTSYTWTGAKNNVQYRFTVRSISADKGAYASGYDNTGRALTYYAAPTVKAANAEKGVQVSWNKVAGAVRYAVYYKQNGGAWKKIGTTVNTSYTWPKAKSGVQYAFTVRVCKDDKTTLLSGYKASDTVRYVAAPKLKSASNVAEGLRVTWEAVNGAERYRVFYKGGGVTKWTKAGDTTGTSLTWTKAKGGAVYTFTVRCLAASGNTYASAYDSTGKSVSRYVGWHTIDGKTYYFDRASGKALTGFKEIEGKWYYLPSGALLTGWHTSDGGITRYFDPQNGGAMATGFQQIGGKYYLLDSKSGQQKTGWQTVDGITRFFDPDNNGAMVTGWQTITGQDYYFKSDGRAASGPTFIDDEGGGDMYLFEKDGKLVVNDDRTLLGKSYHIDEDGVIEGYMTGAMRTAKTWLDECGWELHAAYLKAASIPYSNRWMRAEAGAVHTEWYANYGFANKTGNCYVMNSMLYQMTKLLGYEVYFVEGYVRSSNGGLAPHGWCEIILDGTTYVCDSNFHNETGLNGYLVQYGQHMTWQYANWTRVD